MLTREQYIRKWVRSLKLREVRLRVDYAKARNKFVRAMVKEGEAKRFIVDGYERDLQAALTQSYQATIKQFRDLTIADIGLPEKKNTLFEALMMEWLARNALTKATTIASTDIDLVTEILIEAAAEGLGVESTGSLIRKITQQTPYRAATIARTEIHNAAVIAAMETTREQSREYGVTFNKEWMAVADGRTRPEHIDADGQTVAMDEKFNIGGEMMDAPGDPAGSAENVINCVHPNSVINAKKLNFVTRNWYEGVLIVVKTKSGNQISVTPNHPILTRRGWVAASKISKSDYVISSDVTQPVSFGALDVNNINSTAEHIYNSFCIVGDRMRVAAINVNFHGDIPNSDVDIVRAEGKLRNANHSLIRKKINHFSLASTDFGEGRLLAYSLLFRANLKKGFRLVSNRFMSIGNKLQTIIFTCFGHSSMHSFASVSLGNTMVFEAKNNIAPINVKNFRKTFDRFAGIIKFNNFFGVYRSLSLIGNFPRTTVMPNGNFVFFKQIINRALRNIIPFGELGHTRSGDVFMDNVVNVVHMDYSGYVYNFETNNGYYMCNGIVNHNCRCAIRMNEVISDDF